MKNALYILLLTVLMAGSVPAQEAVFQYDDHEKRDPFWPLVSPVGAVLNYDEQDLMASDMVLEGIMTGENGQNVAIINGNIVEQGDEVGMFNIRSIEPTVVILQKGAETFTLKIKKED